MTDTPKNDLDPIIKASNLLVDFMREEQIDPMVAMTAMTQLASKIAYDSGMQEKLSKEDNRSRWMGGAMLAFDAAAGGEAGFETDGERAVRTMQPGTRKHLSLCPGVGKGTKQGIKRRRTLNKMARKTRRSQRR